MTSITSFDDANFMIDPLAIIDTLETFDERCDYIELLSENEYPFWLEEQPEAWVQRLISKSDAESNKIVNIIIKVFGKDFICIEASAISGYPVYLVDTIGMFLNEIQDIHFDDRISIENTIIHTMIHLKN